MRSRLQPRQRRIPGDVNVAGEVRLHLPFVIREEDVVESEAMARKIALKSVPDGDDFGIVRDRAQEESGVVVHGFPPLKQR